MQRLSRVRMCPDVSMHLWLLSKVGQWFETLKFDDRSAGPSPTSCSGWT